MDSQDDAFLVAALDAFEAELGTEISDEALVMAADEAELRHFIDEYIGGLESDNTAFSSQFKRAYDQIDIIAEDLNLSELIDFGIERGGDHVQAVSASSNYDGDGHVQTVSASSNYDGDGDARVWSQNARNWVDEFDLDLLPEINSTPAIQYGSGRPRELRSLFTIKQKYEKYYKKFQMQGVRFDLEIATPDPDRVPEEWLRRIITTVTAIASVVIAFIQSQITFCLLNKSQIAQRKTIRENRSLYADNDKYVDLEYVIPKKNVSKGVKTTIAQSANAKSWEFDETFEDHQRQNVSSTSSTTSVSPTHSVSIEASPYNNQKNTSKKHRRSSRVSDANSERFMHQMTSFSRCATPSPVPRSGQITPTPFNSGDYYDALGQTSNRLTVDFLSSIAKVKVPINNNQRPSSLSSMSIQDDSQYASMLAELEQSVIEKKIQAGFSPDDASQIESDKYCSSKSSSKDLEFSKELEAALQLIQELETPSEGPLEHGTLSPRAIARSESEKTLSAAVSLPSPDAGTMCAEHSVNSPPFRNEN